MPVPRMLSRGDEAGRVAALRRYQILDTPDESFVLELPAYPAATSGGSA